MAKRDVAVRGNTLPGSWEKQMMERAQQAEEAVAGIGVGQFMSTRGGVLAYQQTPVPGNKMKAVILDALLVNALYPGAFDQDNPQAPVCYAFGRKDSELAPHPDAPEKAAAACAGCPNNKFGSAETGRGKACKNGVRLGLVHADSLKNPAGLADAGVAVLNIPPTSLPSWAQYVNGLKNVTKYGPVGVITEIALVPDAKSQFKLTFLCVSEIKDKKLLAALAQKMGGVTLDFPFPAADADAKPKRSTRQAPAKAKGRGRAAAPATRRQPPVGGARGAGLKPASTGRAKF